MAIRDSLGPYLEMGWVPIPIAFGTKQPVIKFKHMLGYEAPSQIPAEALHSLLEPWNRDPDYNIGIMLKVSQLLLVDCDSLDAVKEAIAITDEPCNNVVQSTNGAHFYYRRPPDCPALRTVRRGDSGKIDVLANGFAVVPPSMHRSGRVYRWLMQGPLQDAPDWAVGMLSAIRERSIANTLIDPQAVQDAFPTTTQEALALLKSINCRDARVAALLSTPGTGKNLSTDRSHAVWLTINTLIRLLGSDIGPTCKEREWLKNTIGDLSDESIAKVIWYGTLGSDWVGEKPRQRGWQWFCDEIARARLEIVAR